MQSLRQKFRDARRPMVNDAHVMRMKKKYGFTQNKYLNTSASSSGSAVPAKRAYIVAKVKVRDSGCKHTLFRPSVYLGSIV